MPEKREELTTEGGLDVAGQFDLVHDAVTQLLKAGMEVSLFIDPDFAQIDAAKKTGAPVIEIHTGAYAYAFGKKNEKEEWSRINDVVKSAGHLKVYAGHGLNVSNLPSLVSIKQIEEYNIGHSIISRAVFVGLKQAIAEIQAILR